jgi:hypothetical protein
MFTVPEDAAKVVPRLKQTASRTLVEIPRATKAPPPVKNLVTLDTPLLEEPLSTAQEKAEL